MAAVLPILFVVLVFAWLTRRNPPDLPCWRTRLLAASVIGATVLTFFTESLSLLKWIDFAALARCWAAANVAALVGILSVRSARRRPPDLRSGFKFLPEHLLIIGMSAIGAITLFIALIAPPNTWDSMTYHMARVCHWIRNRTVAFYPTAILRQLHQNPWAEFAILHLQTLCGGDRLANTVQWFSMAASLVGVSWIAGTLGASRLGQAFAALFAATLPMGVLQSSSTQNDYVTACWLVCFVCFGMLGRNELRLSHSMLAGASLGLAALTKATAYLYAFPFALWLTTSGFVRHRTAFLKHALIAGVWALALNLGHYERNLSLYGHPLGPCRESPEIGHKYTNEIFTPAALLSNLIRNVGMQFASPLPAANRAIEGMIRRAHNRLPISITDPRTTWKAPGFHLWSGACFDECYATNPLHMILIIAAGLLLLLSRRARGLPCVVPCFLAVLGGFAAFCVMLKWQPWHSRLHLPFFVAASPVIAVVLERVTRRLMLPAAALLFLCVLPWLFNGHTRPLIGPRSICTHSRIEQYFTGRPDLLLPYVRTALALSSNGCSNVGLSMGDDDWEYPLWIVLQAASAHPPRIEHVGVTNISARTQIPDFSPCAVVATQPLPPENRLVSPGPAETNTFGSVSVILRRQ